MCLLLGGFACIVFIAVVCSRLFCVVRLIISVVCRYTCLSYIVLLVRLSALASFLFWWERCGFCRTSGCQTGSERTITDNQTNRQADQLKHTHKLMNNQTNKHPNKQTCKHANKHKNKHASKHTRKHRHTQSNN